MVTYHICRCWEDPNGHMMFGDMIREQTTQLQDLQEANCRYTAVCEKYEGR